MMAERHIQDPETEVLFHRPGNLHMERLVPDGAGSMCFRLHPWERAKDRSELVLRGRPQNEEVLVRDARPSVKSRARKIDGTAQSEHADWIKSAQHAMSEGPLKKVVLSSLLNVEVEGLDTMDIVRRLALAHPESFSWAFSNPEVGTWFGSSPEPLIKGKWPQMRTACLAGTRMAHMGDVSDPWTEKEREEQDLVTEGALQALQQSGCADIRTSERQTIQYGPIEHLRTWVDFEATRPLEEVIQALHPTPAVGGTPRTEALDFISEYETHDRAYYTGWVGMEEGEDLSYFVNLRCAHLRGGIMTAYAGGGITAASNAAAEWAETRNKLRSVLDPIVHWEP
ncbi:MAG: chorismate-binding protein [Flavobacteriales bacterium]|nr:chorismate-binding protein [Flavobacteriales bacterium]